MRAEERVECFFFLSSSSPFGRSVRSLSLSQPVELSRSLFVFTPNVFLFGEQRFPNNISETSTRSTAREIYSLPSMGEHLRQRDGTLPVDKLPHMMNEWKAFSTLPLRALSEPTVSLASTNFFPSSINHEGSGERSRSHTTADPFYLRRGTRRPPSLASNAPSNPPPGFPNRRDDPRISRRTRSSAR